LFDGQLRFARDAPIPRRDGEALIRVICAGICGTDLEITKGYANFRGILGHEFVGRVVESPSRYMLGRRVVGQINVGCGKCHNCLTSNPGHCPERTALGIRGRDGAFAEFLSLPPQNLFEIPDSISDEAAVFAEPLAAACRILEQVDILDSSRVAIVGDGRLAQLIVRALAHVRCETTMIGKHAEKLRLGEEAGARAITLGQAEKEAQKFDIVIEASGSTSGLPLALALVKPLGTVVLKSTHHGMAAADISTAVINEVTIIGSRCGPLQRAIDLLASGAVNPLPLISARLPLEEGIRAFQKATEPGALKVLLELVG
jgi:alcohol dehydrogenase